MHQERMRIRGTRRHAAWRGFPFAALAGIVLCLGLSADEPEPAPDLVSYQGVIYLEGGSTDVSGAYDMEFELYGGPPDRELLWGERHQAVQVAHGRFSVILGAGGRISDPIPHGDLHLAFRRGEVYIQVTVGSGEGEAHDFVSPVRHRFASASYALRAQNAATATHAVPPGTVMPFAGSIVPYGWLRCDGQRYERSGRYAALFEAIGTAFSIPGMDIYVYEGEDAVTAITDTTFNVPNLCSRIPVCVDEANGYVPGYRRGATDHRVTLEEMPNHSHQYGDKRWEKDKTVLGPDCCVAKANSTQTAGETSEYPGLIGRVHNNMQPTSIVKYIIKW